MRPTAATRRLREEHDRLREAAPLIREAADAVGYDRLPVERERLDDVLTLLFDRLMPHAEAEETTLYPVIDRLLGTATTSAALRADHLEIARLARRLVRLRASLAAGTPPRDGARELRAVLYALHSLVLLHLDREDRVCLPVVDAGLRPHRAARLAAELERATAEARAVPARL